MQLSGRLLAVSGMVASGRRLADVGTDHGYVPIYLVQEGRIDSAIAMDVNRGPLLRAQLHIRQYGLEGKIETRLSDGLAQLEPGEADAILLAGMGGMLMIRILRQGAAAVEQARELILQPQSDIRALRQYLASAGYGIDDEEMVEEDGKFYTVMRAVRGAAAAQGELALRYGPVLLARRHPVLARYLEKERGQLARVREALSGETGTSARERLAEVEEELWQNGRARALLSEQQEEESYGTAHGKGHH